MQSAYETVLPRTETAEKRRKRREEACRKHGIRKGSLSIDRLPDLSFLCALRFELKPINVTLVDNSVQAPSRHPEGSALCCFVPDLTRFTDFRRVGDPDINATFQRQLHQHMPSAQYHPCYSGLQVFGTATTPATESIVFRGKSQHTSLPFVSCWCKIIHYEDIINRN